MLSIDLSFATFDSPSKCLSKKAYAWPAFFINLSEVFHALEVNWKIFSFFLSCLFADGVGFVNIINAKYLKIMGTLCSGC
jgi:hypothetical protein